MTIDAPGSRSIYPFQDAINIFIISAVIAVLITLWWLFRQTTTKTSKKILLIAWGTLPPLWFLIEYFFIFLPYGLADTFNFFKYGQDVASKLWAGVFVIISFSLFKD